MSGTDDSVLPLVRSMMKSSLTQATTSPSHITTPPRFGIFGSAEEENELTQVLDSWTGEGPGGPRTGPNYAALPRFYYERSNNREVVDAVH